MTIVASGACNLRCSYCRLLRTDEVPPWPAVRRALNAVLGRVPHDIHVGFTGGEPLLAWPLIERSVSHLEACADRAGVVSYKLMTNGLLLDEERVAFLERHRFEVQVSLDGAADAQAMRNPDTFDRLVRLLARLRRRHRMFFEKRVSVALTLTPANVPHLARSVRFLLEQGVRRIQIGAAMGTGREPVRIRELDRQFRHVFETAREWFVRTGQIPVTNLRPSLGEAAAPPGGRGWICDAPVGREIVVDADGAAAACLMATRTYAGAAPAAMRRHVRALGEGRPSPALFGLPSRRYSSYGRCRSCRWAGSCLVCPLAAVQEREWDDPFRVPDFACAFWRTVLKYRERMPSPPVPPGLESLAPFLRRG